MSDSTLQRPWDPVPGETPRRYGQFRAYVDLGADRTVSDAAAAVGVKAGTLYDLSSRFDWCARALAHDVAMAQRRAEALLEGREKMARRRLRRAREADGVSRALIRAGLRPAECEIQLQPSDCFRYGERFALLATELEERALGNEPEKPSESVIDELLGLDGPSLQRVADEARHSDTGEQEEVRDD